MARRTRTELKRIGVKIIQGGAPVLSGNLQQNAINASDAPKGAMIYVDDRIAIYGWHLDRGAVSGKGQASKGWFSVRGSDALAVFMNAEYNGKKTSLTSTIERVNANKPDNLSRQATYLRNIKRK